MIQNVTVYYDDYSQMTKQQISIPSSTAATWLSLSGSYIKFNHPLINDIANINVNVGAFYVEFDVEHADNPAFNRHIKIVQYPAMYISYRQSNARVFVNGYNRGAPNGYNSGTVTAYSDANDNIGSVVDPDSVTGTGSNVNRNNYIIHVSVLNDRRWRIADNSEDLRLPCRSMPANLMIIGQPVPMQALRYRRNS